MAIIMTSYAEEALPINTDEHQTRRVCISMDTAI